MANQNSDIIYLYLKDVNQEIQNTVDKTVTLSGRQYIFIKIKWKHRYEWTIFIETLKD